MQDSAGDANVQPLNLESCRPAGHTYAAAAVRRHVYMCVCVWLGALSLGTCVQACICVHAGASACEPFHMFACVFVYACIYARLDQVRQLLPTAPNKVARLLQRPEQARNCIKVAWACLANTCRHIHETPLGCFASVARATQPRPRLRLPTKGSRGVQEQDGVGDAAMPQRGPASLRAPGCVHCRQRGRAQKQCLVDLSGRVSLTRHMTTQHPVGRPHAARHNRLPASGLHWEDAPTASRTFTSACRQHWALLTCRKGPQVGESRKGHVQGLPATQADTYHTSAEAGADHTCVNCSSGLLQGRAQSQLAVGAHPKLV